MELTSGAWKGGITKLLPSLEEIEIPFLDLIISVHTGTAVQTFVWFSMLKYSERHTPSLHDF